MFTRRRQADRSPMRANRRRAVLFVESMEERHLLSSAAFAVTQDWGTGFGGQVTITNTNTTPVNNWSLAFDFDRSITDIWDGTITSHVGNHYVIGNAGWNSTIAAGGGTAEFGFNGASGNVGTDKPTNFTLNGVSLGATTPSLSIADNSVKEGETAGTTPITFTVSLAAAATSTVTVHYTTANVTAKAGTNYTAKSGTLTFNPGTLSQTITVSIINATTSSPNLTFDVNLSSASGAAISKATGVGTIIDTVAPPAKPPVANPVTATTVEASAVNLNVLASDSDPNNQTLKVKSFTQPTNGTVTQNADGTLTYTPKSTFIGTDTFQYTIVNTSALTATSSVTITVTAPVTTAGAWPTHVYAPYVDMTLYPTYNLVSTAQAQGLKYFTLAFVVTDPSNNAPSWGGYNSYDINGGAFDLAIRSQITSLRQMGGDVMVSFGGEAGSELAQSITSVPALTAAYQQVINAYGLTHIDFDVEGAAEADTASIDRRNQAIASLEATATAAGKTLSVSYTLPVLPTGLTSDGLYVLQSAQKYGAKIADVNIMTMDFGDYAAPKPAGQMGTYVIDSGQSLFTQLQTLYGSSMTTAQLWSEIGLTPMIGVNDSSDEIFTEADANQVLAWAQSKGIGRISIWSLNRDQEDPAGALSYAEDNSSSIVQNPYDFSNIFKKFTS